MSYEQTVTCKCDRCGAVVKTGNGDEDDWKNGDDPPAFEAKRPNPKAEDGIEVLSFDDLCEACQKRIDALWEGLKTGRSRGKGSRGGKKAKTAAKKKGGKQESLV